MKCVITGEETKSLMKGKPVSIEGRNKVKAYIQKFDESVLPGLGFMMSTRMAMNDLFRGYDILDEYTKAKEEREKKDVSKEGE